MRGIVPVETAVYCEFPPEIEFHDDGMVHVIYRVGSIIFRAVMRPSTYSAALKAAGRVADQIAERRPIPISRARRGRH